MTRPNDERNIMRFHTNLRYSDIVTTLNRLANEGKVSTELYFTKLDDHGSQSHERAFEVQLACTSPANGAEKRRRCNGYGVSYDDNYSATWSEWGWLMAALYEKDPEATWGTGKYAAYSNEADFHYKTEYVFDGYSEHFRIPVRDLDKGDRLIGSNIQGSGVKFVKDVDVESNRRAVLKVSQTNPWNGYKYQTTIPTNPDRLVWVARETASV